MKLLEQVSGASSELLKFWNLDYENRRQLAAVFSFWGSLTDTS